MTKSPGTSDDGARWNQTLTYVTSANASATPLVVTAAPATGEKVVLDDLYIWADADMVLTLRTTTSNTTVARIPLTANVPEKITTRGRFQAPDVNRTLEVLASASGNIYSTALSHSEA